MKKREISDIEKEECKLLKQIFNDRKKELGLSQAKIAGLIGVTQAAINHYLNGTNALNASIASEFAKVLGVPVGSFSWRLEKEINEMSNSLIISGGVINGALNNNIGGVYNNTSYTLNQNSVSKPTKEELADADKHFLKSMPLLDIDIAVRHLANPDKDRTQIQGDGDRAATFIPRSRHTIGVRMADDVEFAGIKRGDILIVSRISHREIKTWCLFVSTIQATYAAWWGDCPLQLMGRILLSTMADQAFRCLMARLLPE